MKRGIKLVPRVNASNKQINFSLKKSDLPKKIKQKLPKLKSIKLEFDDMEFDEL